jgi:hypothetical protein
VDGICVCDYLWTGVADYFPLNSCQNHVVIDKIFWAFSVMMMLSLWLSTFRVFQNQLTLCSEGRRETSKTGRSRDNTMVYAYGVAWCVALPGVIAVFAAHVATDLHFGVDLSITVGNSVFFALYLGAIAVIEHVLFKLAVEGATSRDKARGMVHNDKIGKIVGLVFYMGFSSGTQIGMCFVPQGPTLARIALLITLISSSTLYFAHYYWVHMVILTKLKTIVGDRDSAMPRASDATLLKLIDDTEETKKTMILLFVINTVFSVCPPLYSFYYVVPGLLMGASSGKGNSMRYLSKGKDKSSGVGNPGTTTKTSK